MWNYQWGTTASYLNKEESSKDNRGRHENLRGISITDPLEGKQSESMLLSNLLGNSLSPITYRCPETTRVEESEESAEVLVMRTDEDSI